MIGGALSRLGSFAADAFAHSADQMSALPPEADIGAAQINVDGTMGHMIRMDEGNMAVRSFEK